MLIDDENIRVQYDSTAESPIMAGDALPFPFRFIEKEQVKAILLDGTKLVFNEDYTVGLEEEEEEKPEGEDEASVSSDYTSVILNIDIPIGETITLYRETDLDQTSEFPQEARFSSRKIEDALDKLTMQNQEQREALGRAMKLPLTAAVDLKDLALPNPEPNKSVKWNSDGTALVNTNFDPDTALVTTENFKKQAEQSAKDSANSAAASANSATVAGQKVNEITALHSDYMDDINTTSTDYLTQINSLGNTIIKNADAIINRVGLSMFDTVTKDYELTYEESKGLALQGTWVYKIAIAGERYGYPDFYNKCLEEKEQAGEGFQYTLDGLTTTFYKNANGHQFYDIADKEVIDTWFEKYGYAWSYGIDTENERIFLPRNNYFIQLTGDVSEVGESVGAGLPNITGEISGPYDGATSLFGELAAKTVKGALYITNYGSRQGINGGGSYNLGEGIAFNASYSNSIYGRSNTVQPNAVKKLLYICVGNAIADTSWVDVVTQVQGGVKDLEDKKNASIAEIDVKAKSYDNLTNRQITNCLLEVPQRIKYTLENGTLTLKAGSVVTVPNGFEDDGVTPKFEYFTLETDRREDTDFGYDSKHVLCYMPSTSGFFNPQIEICVSGDTKPNIAQYMLWYDTINNKIKWSNDYGASWTGYPISFPVLTGYLSAKTVWTSIDQIFNGMGYFGSTIWVDKGVKGLIPNGRTEDGALNNIEFETSKVLTREIHTNLSSANKFVLFNGEIHSWAVKNYTYDTDKNLFHWFSPDAYYSICELGSFYGDNGVISNFQPKQPFRAVDHSDKQEVISWSMPDYSAGIAKVSGTQYTAEVDGWLEIRTDDYNNRSYLTLNGIEKCISGASNNHLANIYCIIPIPKGTTFKVVHSRTNTANLYNFYPCKGGK